MKTLVIDDRSSGADLVSALRKRGAEVEVYRPAQPYELDHSGDVPELPADLQALCTRFSPEFIVAGSEYGVSLADVAAARYTRHHNKANLSFARRNKAGMVDALREAGIRHPQTVKITSLDNVRDALGELTGPLVVKPSGSAGSDMCTIVDDLNSAESAVRKILAATNALGVQNESATVQEYLAGPQLYVNAVSAHGRHVVTDVATEVVHEVAGRPTITGTYTLDPDDERAYAAIDYVLSCLDALGVSFGASHTEIRMTESGPNLIEFNGRLMGPCMPEDIYTEVCGYSQATVFADLLHTGTLDGCDDILWGRRRIGLYLLSPNRSGTLVDVDFSPLMAIPGVSAVLKTPDPGTAVVTENRLTTGTMGLVHYGAQNQSEAADIVAAIRDLELHDKLFVIEDVMPAHGDPR